MNRYSSYKDSGEKWLGEIPSHWKVIKSKYLWREKQNRSNSGKETLLSVSQYDGVTPSKDESRSESLEGYKVVNENDLVINIMLAWLGGLGVSKYEGVVSPAYCIYSQKGNNCPQYLHYLYRTPTYLAEFARHSTGVVPSRWRMYTDDFGQVPTLLPPLNEQQAIASYLDSATAKLDAAIAREQKMIDLLNERKQIIINHAVTKGLNPNAKLKDSGVDWIWEIPEGWETIPLRFVFEIRNGYTPSKSVKEYWEDGIIPWYRMEDIHKSGRILHDSIQHITKKAIKGGGLFSAGSFILATCTASIGEHAMLMVDSLANQRFINLKIGEAYSSKYNPLYIYFYMFIVGKFCRHTSNSTTFQNADINELKNFPILLPSIEEQNSIVDRLKSRLKDLDETLDKTSKMISLLQERKQIIINDVVTGKIKVF